MNHRFIGLLSLSTIFLLSCSLARKLKSNDNNSPEPSTTNTEVFSHEGSEFLAKPTGRYGVGYMDYHFIDTNRCPGPFYSEETKGDYTPTNDRFCREILARVYYPTMDTSAPPSNYDKTQLLSLKGEYESYATALGEKLDLDFSEILNMKSFSRDGAKVSDTEKFPVVFFTTGDNSSVQKYENLITNTVSHGYIVVGINSPFLSGDNLLPTGHVIKTSKAKNDDLDHNVRSDDIFYIQKNIHKIGQVYDVMILNKLSIIGHSAGANAVAKIIESKDHPFSAAIAMDADVRENFQGFEIPFLHELAATRYWGTKYGAPAARVSFTPKYILKDNNYLVAIVESKDNLLNAHPDGPLYSHHTSFTDVATLLKSEPFQEALPTLEKLVELIFGHPFQSPLGDGDGQEIAAIMNLYVVDFLNFYIKGTKSSIFGSSNCHAIIDKSIASCGPVIFP